MPKDALTIYRAALELDMLVGGRVDKVTMPDAETIILLFHTQRGNHRLLLSCNPSLPRAHITVMQYKNPETATGTLMYFRKRLVGATLKAIEKDRCERVIGFEFSAFDELREPVQYSLKAELTGKCANIIFVEQNGIIGNCLRKISAEAEGKRAVLVGLKYTPPNPTGRIGIFDRAELKARMAAFDGASARTAINKCISGLASATVDELFFRLGIGDDVPPSDDVIDRFIDKAQKLYCEKTNPTVTFDGVESLHKRREQDCVGDLGETTTAYCGTHSPKAPAKLPQDLMQRSQIGKPLDYFVVPYVTAGGVKKHYDTVNAAMDEYYSALFAAADFSTYVKPLRNAVKTADAKNKKRLAEAVAKLAESETAEDDRIIGDLITANIYRIKRGDESVVADNFYDENGGKITIRLDVTKNAQQNAAMHYKAYTKKKKAAVYAQDAIQKATEAIAVLDGITAELDLCTEKLELDEVRAELVSLGLIKPEQTKRRQKPVPSEPYSFDIEGCVLLVGKNHAQNDRITRGAVRTDTWLHVKDAHGSHAILKTPTPTQSQIARAAEIAAYYSQSRASQNVAVDYTTIKHVYPHGGGKVDYKEYKTIYVNPKN